MKTSKHILSTEGGGGEGANRNREMFLNFLYIHIFSLSALD